VKIRLITFSRGRTDWADTAAKDYGRRIARYTSFEEVQARPYRGKAVGEGQKEEGARLLKLVRPREWLIALDERGDSLSSEAWAGLLEKAAEEQATGLVFAIGGAYGHGEAVRSQARQCISLSPMVLNHQVARVLVLEQLYRAWTIIRREPYHHA
jgi:23S rRNA (pseudouridine1915-N3)-methyltransferase